MWRYKRRLSIHPIVSTVTFAGHRLTVAPDGSILTPIDDALALKMKRAQHIFTFTVDAPAAPAVEAPAVEIVEAALEQEQVESSSVKDDNDKAMRKRKRRKVEG
jgi:hypothetical protein